MRLIICSCDLQKPSLPVLLSLLPSVILKSPKSIRLFFQVIFLCNNFSDKHFSAMRRFLRMKQKQQPSDRVYIEKPKKRATRQFYSSELNGRLRQSSISNIKRQLQKSAKKLPKESLKPKKQGNTQKTSALEHSTL